MERTSLGFVPAALNERKIRLAIVGAQTQMQPDRTTLFHEQEARQHLLSEHCSALSFATAGKAAADSERVDLAAFARRHAVVMGPFAAIKRALDRQSIGQRADRYLFITICFKIFECYRPPYTRWMSKKPHSII